MQAAQRYNSFIESGSDLINVAVDAEQRLKSPNMSALERHQLEVTRDNMYSLAGEFWPSPSLMEVGPTSVLEKAHTVFSELEWRVIPALMLDQAKLYMRDKSPLAFVSWARLSPEAAQRYRTPPHQLSFNDWNSGDETWLVDVITPFGGLSKVMEELRKGALTGQSLRQLAPSPADPSKAVTWPAL